MDGALDMNLVSIVMPVFNAGRFLNETMASVRAQTHRNWQLIAVLDPLSSDESQAIIENLCAQDSRIVSRVSPSAGPAAARNLAMALAQGEWTAFLDADDVWLPAKLEKQISFMQDRDAIFSATEYRRICESGERTGRHVHLPRQIGLQRLLKQNSLCCSSVMALTSAVSHLRFLDEGCEDFRFWLEILRKGGTCHILQEDLVRYRVVSTSRSSRRWPLLQDSWRILSHELGAMRGTLQLPEFVARGLLKHARF